jgi:ribosomal protein S18 acetylase RimI-like enzyme
MKRLATHASLVRSNARQERRRRALESTIRRAVPDDVDAIVRLVSVGAESGAFDQKVFDSEKLIALASHFRSGIADGRAIRDVWNGGQTSVPIEFWVSVINGNVAGFFMVLGLDQNKGAERELHAIAVDQAYRGLGVGSAMVDFFCSHYAQRRLFVLCKPDTVMMGMLKRRNFVVGAQTNMAFELLVREA